MTNFWVKVMKEKGNKKNDTSNGVQYKVQTMNG